MKNKHLLNLIGEIDDRHIEEAAPVAKKKHSSLWVKGIVAACICILVGHTYSYLNPTSLDSILNNNFTRVDMGYATTHVTTSTMQEDYKAEYGRVSAAGYRLKSLVGEEYTHNDSVKWYRVKGYENIKYLIQEDAYGDFSLWCFESFVVSEGETYTYGDILRIIYNVDSAEDIVSITTSPFKANNSDEGKAMQAEVGTHTYTDREDILAFYNIVKKVICYGADAENPADNTRFTYSFSVQDGHKLVAKDGIYGTRCISIEFTDGTVLDSWKYSALSGSFFEYGSIFTEPLDEEDVYILNDIFGIK
ncbi:MAG: hypothetical protein IJ455_03130 [Agathobacter sp.]|nr:hypothetical protein [Agathobacter sp.]